MILFLIFALIRYVSLANRATKTRILKGNRNSHHRNSASIKGTTTADRTSVEPDRDIQSYQSDNGKSDEESSSVVHSDGGFISRGKPFFSGSSSVKLLSQLLPRSLKSAKIDPNTNESIIGTASGTVTNLQVKSVSHEIDEDC